MKRNCEQKTFTKTPKKNFANLTLKTITKNYSDKK